MHVTMPTTPVHTVDRIYPHKIISHTAPNNIVKHNSSALDTKTQWLSNPHFPSYLSAVPQIRATNPHLPGSVTVSLNT